MSSVLLIRIILVVILFVILLIIYRINKMILLEKRISRYTLKRLSYEEISFLDKILINYDNIVKKFYKNKIFQKLSDKYNRYLYGIDNTNTIYFIINKLLIAFMFVILIIVSNAIKGNIISFLTFVFCFVIGYYIYDIYLIYALKYRKKKIKNDMLRAVIVMNNAFKVGKSVLQAVLIVSNTLPRPIAIEFKKVHQDMSYGLSADVAFSRFAKRVDLEEANFIASSLTILNKTGGNIVNVFSSIERTLFDKKKLESDLKNSTAASNLVVKFLMIVPIVFILLIYIVSPTYFNPLFESIFGYFIIGIILVMLVIYLYLLNKILKVEV